MATVYSYDNLGRVTGIDAGTGVVQFGYSYVDDENNIYRKTFDHRSGDPYNEYSYDDLDRLIGVTYHDTDAEAFVMDDLGNRTGDQTLRADGTVPFNVDAATNRYTHIDVAEPWTSQNQNVFHDEAGNMTGDKDGYVYFYDYENRIVKIEDDSSSTVATFEYDALGRRIRKVDAVAAVTTLYYYDPDWRCLEERNGSDVVQRSFIYGNYIDEVLVMTVPGSPPTDYYYLQDHLYSPAALLAADGTVVERYEYDAYGTVHVFDGSWNRRAASAYGNPYTFTGRRLDWLDNACLKIMYYRYRYYDPFPGRFLQEDPVGHVDGLNLYVYAGGTPTIAQDPLGLRKVIVRYYVRYGRNSVTQNLYMLPPVTSGDWWTVYQNTLQILMGGPTACLHPTSLKCDTVEVQFRQLDRNPHKPSPMPNLGKIVSNGKLVRVNFLVILNGQAVTQAPGIASGGNWVAQLYTKKISAVANSSHCSNRLNVYTNILVHETVWHSLLRHYGHSSSSLGMSGTSDTLITLSASECAAIKEALEIE